MNNQTNGKLRTPRLKALLAAGVLVAGLGLAATASATLTVVSVNGGAATGATHENFDNCALGNASCTTASGIVVSFTPVGQIVNGTLENFYAAPFLSGGNGNSFGDNPPVNQPNGVDTTNFITSGSTGGSGSQPGSSATLTFSGQEKYMGLLWGSVDTYNTLTFYNGSTLVGTITGTDVDALANGNQGAQGTFYVNINSTDPFTSVVATSTSFAFEFDNVAFSENIPVPEPGVIGMFLFGLLLLGSGYWLKRREHRVA